MDDSRNWRKFLFPGCWEKQIQVSVSAVDRKSVLFWGFLEEFLFRLVAFILDGFSTRPMLQVQDL